MKTRTYEDFDLSIEKSGDRYRARVLSSPDGTAPATEFDMPFSNLELENFILRFGQTRRTMRNIGIAGQTVNRSLSDFGSRLFDAIFSGPVSDRLHGSLGVVSQKEATGLRIRLRLSDAPELIDVPWEYLFDASSGRFLTLSVDTPVVRYLDLPGQVRPLAVQSPLRILVMISSPTDYAELNVEQEWKKLKDAVADLESRGLVVLERMKKPTLAELQRRLRREDVHIFHFIGHGGFDEAAQDGVLILQTEDGRAKPTSGKYLGTLLHDEKTVQLAVLNACEGGRTSRQDPFAGVGQGLVQQGIPAVVAMQFEISDQAAITLAHEFYAALADNYPVDAALAEARKAIFAQDNIVEWGTPVLYMSVQDGRIFDLTTVAASPSITQRANETPLTTATDATSSSPLSNSVPHKTSLGEQIARPLGAWLGRNWARARSTPVSFGVRIASWSALVALIGFLLPWAPDYYGGTSSGVGVAIGGLAMPVILLILLSPVAVLAIRGWMTGREGIGLGVLLTALGLVPVMGLIVTLAGGDNQKYGFTLTVAACLGILAGGMAELVLPKHADRSKPTSGHIVALIGAGLALVGSLLAMKYTRIGEALLGVTLLVASTILIWILALMAVRRGRLIWLDSVGVALAAAIGIIGVMTLSTIVSSADIAVAGLGCACMAVGGAVNFVLAARQNLGGTSAGHRLAILGLFFAVPLAVGGALMFGFYLLLLLLMPILGVLGDVLRTRRRTRIDKVDVWALISLGLMTSAVCLIAGIAALSHYRIDEVLLGIIAPGILGGGLMVWGGLLNRRALHQGGTELKPQS